ncbi:hypothetical protein DMN91_011347 [Ooceraea biroi]|uniref:ERAP1-like C-terminal domain-containing protein n=1 Tax=Ooceraea biroi TaxID=2015173 RepID=A0A3L8DBK1_OOCBI|nr:hypothetical protein DMN91_011347 [Ooceraea biroi]
MFIEMQASCSYFILKYVNFLVYNDNEGKALRHCVPITFTTWEELDFNNTVPHDWITPKNSNGISVQLTDNNGWIILNLQQTDYLLYEKYEKIHVLNRAQLIDDTYYFLMRGKASYSQFVKLTEYLSRERDYVAWYPMFQIFIDLSYFLPFEDSAFLKFDMCFILKHLLSTLSYKEKVNEDDLTKWLRQEAVKWACIFGDTHCQQIATDRLKEHLEDPTNPKLSLEWREWTYCKGAIKANESVLLKLKELLNIKHSKIFNYISCAEIPHCIIDIFYSASLKEKDRYPTLFSYAIFVDYAVKHINGTIEIMKEHNASLSDKIKLLVVIINHLYSEVEVQQISNLLGCKLKGTKLCGTLNGVINRRLRQIAYQKSRLLQIHLYRHL